MHVYKYSAKDVQEVSIKEIKENLESKTKGKIHPYIFKFYVGNRLVL
jgi:hypothetical protein